MLSSITRPPKVSVSQALILPSCFSGWAGSDAAGAAEAALADGVDPVRDVLDVDLREGLLASRVLGGADWTAADALAAGARTSSGPIFNSPLVSTGGGTGTALAVGGSDDNGGSRSGASLALCA